jgi:hypothetical protein
MSFLKKLFSRSRNEIWEALCAEIDAKYIEGGRWKGDKVTASVGEWTVTLDTFTVNTQYTHQVFTRLRAPFVNADGFRFKIYRKGSLSGLGKKFGMQDVEVGYPEFDEEFIIKGSDESKLMSFFSNNKLREKLSAQKTVNFEVKDDEGFFGAKFPEGVDELYFQETGVINDIERLKSLFGLFAEILNQLCHIGSAYENDPELEL